MDWPLVVNVPLGRGAVKAGESIVVRQGGALLPTQARTLVSWPDGSPRWVRLDSILPARAQRGAALAVVTAAPPAPSAKLEVEETKRGIAVDTGAIAFEIPKQHFAIAEKVRFAGSDKATVAAIGTSMVADGQVQIASPPRSLLVTNRGPVHAEIEMRGDWGADFEYLIRVAIDAGSPFIRVLHTYTKTGGRSETVVERMSIDVPFTAPLEGEYVAGATRGKPLSGSIADDATQSFAQIDAATFDVAGESRDGALAGWFELAGKKAAVGLAARWFGQEYPKAVSLGAAGVTYDLWSPKGGHARIGIGSAKTHELVVWLAPRGTVGKARAGAVATPLRGSVEPAAVARSGALQGAIDPTATELDEDLLAATRRYLTRNARDTWDDCGRVRCDGNDAVLRTGAFGMLNWGDWNFPGLRDTVKGTDAWGNLEYDTTQVLALTYAATADPVAFDAMVAAARHYMDVDVIHALPGRAEWVGMNHPKNPRHFTFDLGGVDLGHTWTEGLLSYYQLTGDERALHVARGIADYLVRRLSDFLRGNPRQWGWPQIALAALYDVTGEARYCDAAAAYARGAMAAHPPEAPAGKKTDWKLGILADALAHTHACAGGAPIESWLQRYARYVAARRPRDSRFYPAVAYAGRMANNPEWVELARQRARGLQLGNWGKPLSIQGRVGLRILSLTQSPPVGPSGSPAVPGRATTWRPPSP